MKIDQEVKSISNIIKTEKKRKKNIDKIRQLEIESVKIKYVDNPNKLQSDSKELHEIQVVDKNLHPIRNGILRDYASEFEMIRKISIVDQICELILDLEKLLIMKLISILSMKDLMQKMLFSMVIFIK